jgi:hypothetical protein
LAAVIREGGKEDYPPLFVSCPGHCGTHYSAVRHSDDGVVLLARSQDLSQTIDGLETVGLGALPQFQHRISISGVVFTNTKRHRYFLTRRGRGSNEGCGGYRGEEAREWADMVVAHGAASLQRVATIAGVDELCLHPAQIVTLRHKTNAEGPPPIPSGES